MFSWDSTHIYQHKIDRLILPEVKVGDIIKKKKKSSKKYAHWINFISNIA